MSDSDRTHDLVVLGATGVAGRLTAASLADQYTPMPPVRQAVDSPLDGGVLTPASGIGMPLAERLREVGFTASVTGDDHA